MRFQIRKPRYLIKPDSKMDKWLSKQFGSTLFSYGEIISMFIPIMLDQFFINFISVLTTSMISASSQESDSAVSLVSPVYMMIFAIFNAVSAGGTVIVAQYKGKGDNEKMRTAAGTSGPSPGRPAPPAAPRRTRRGGHRRGPGRCRKTRPPFAGRCRGSPAPAA